MKARSVEYAPRSKLDLASIYDFIAEAASPSTALGFIDRIEQFCESLSLASERGQRQDDTRLGLRSVGFERRVTIVFHVSDETVSVLRIFYAGRNWRVELDDLD